MKKILYIIGILAAVGILWFAYYAISPLFINIKADEALPGRIEKIVTPTTSPEVATKITEANPLRASVVDTPTHPASGFARILKVEDKTYLRYEDYKTINGPDLYVYLAKDLEAKEFINLGRLKATEGNVNYEIPANINIEEYPYALTWCKQFGVLFNSADLTSQY